MRYVSGVIVWADGHLHPLESAIAACPAVTIEITHQISRQNERLVELCEFSGDLSRLDTLLSEEETVLVFEITPETGLVYLEYQPSPSMTTLFDILTGYSLIIVPPLEYTDEYADRGIRLTVVSTESAIAAISADVPQEIELYPERVGEYVPERVGLSNLLTERQQSVFLVAVDLGYYEVPRETTHEQIAEAVKRSPATVSEQLQRIESRLLLQYVK